MLIYEVNTEIVSSIKEPYLAWLAAHIKEVVVCGKFTKAEYFTVEKAMTRNSTLSFTIHYHATSHELLGEYLALHAPRLREDAQKHFGEKFTSTRRILSSISCIHPSQPTILNA